SGVRGGWVRGSPQGPAGTTAPRYAQPVVVTRRRPAPSTRTAHSGWAPHRSVPARPLRGALAQGVRAHLQGGQATPLSAPGRPRSVAPLATAPPDADPGRGAAGKRATEAPGGGAG